MKLPRAISLFAAIAPFWLNASTPAAAEDFYRDKTLTINVGFSPGGGFDANARTLARFIGRHIPGSPRVIVVNMPGAASVTSIMNLDANAPKDGTVIDTFNFGLISGSVLQPEVNKVDLRNYSWIGSISQDLTVCYLWKKPGAATTVAEMKKGGVFHFGDDGVGTSEDINERILKMLFGVDIRQITGYPGTAEVRLSLQRGELEGDCGAWSSLPPDWVDQKKINPLTRSGPIVPEGLDPSTPYIADLAPDEKTREVVNLLVAGGQVGRPFIASRSVPADRIKILRDAFDATMKDPEFIADLKKQRLPYSPKSGEEALNAVQSIYASSPDVVAAARKVVTQ